jgi:hypothetical protein
VKEKAIMEGNGVIQIVLSSAAVIGGVGYIIHTAWSGYGAFKKDVYDKLGTTIKTDFCKDFRDRVGTDVKRIEDDVREIRRRQDG